MVNSQAQCRWIISVRKSSAFFSSSKPQNAVNDGLEICTYVKTEYCTIVYSNIFQVFSTFQLCFKSLSLWIDSSSYIIVGEYSLWTIQTVLLKLLLVSLYVLYIYNIVEVEVEVEVLISVKVCLLQTSLELSIFIILAQIFTTFSPVSQHSLSILHETVELKMIPIVWLWACEPFFHGRRLCKWKCYYSRLSQAPL